MNFQTSCMAFVTDEQQQIELQKWMNGIGWQVRGGRIGEPRFLVADTDQNSALWVILNESARECFARDFYDCSENIEMFKALAAMNSDNDWEQWFVADCIMKFDVLKGHVKTESGRRIIYPGEWFKVLVPHIGNVRAKWMSLYRPKFLSHKATKNEIFEHYKGKKQ